MNSLIKKERERCAKIAAIEAKRGAAAATDNEKSKTGYAWEMSAFTIQRNIEQGLTPEEIEKDYA